jgi:hypothetical protein
MSESFWRRLLGWEQAVKEKGMWVMVGSQPYPRDDLFHICAQLQ